MRERPTWPSPASPPPSLPSPKSQAVTALPRGSMFAVRRAAGAHPPEYSPYGAVLQPLRQCRTPPVCLGRLGTHPLCNLPITK